MTEKEEQGCAVILPWFLIVAVIAPVLRGWILCLMWGWFITPVFSTLAPRLPVAIGLMLIVAYAVPVARSSDKTDTRKPVEKMMEMAGVSLVLPLFYLGMAWIVKLFV